MAQSQAPISHARFVLAGKRYKFFIVCDMMMGCLIKSPWKKVHAHMTGNRELNPHEVPSKADVKDVTSLGAGMLTRYARSTLFSKVSFPTNYIDPQWLESSSSQSTRSLATATTSEILYGFASAYRICEDAARFDPTIDEIEDALSEYIALKDIPAWMITYISNFIPPSSNWESPQLGSVYTLTLTRINMLDWIHDTTDWDCQSALVLSRFLESKIRVAIVNVMESNNETAQPDECSLSILIPIKCIENDLDVVTRVCQDIIQSMKVGACRDIMPTSNFLSNLTFEFEDQGPIENLRVQDEESRPQTPLLKLMPLSAQLGQLHADVSEIIDDDGTGDLRLVPEDCSAMHVDDKNYLRLSAALLWAQNADDLLNEVRRELEDVRRCRISQVFITAYPRSLGKRVEIFVEFVNPMDIAEQAVLESVDTRRCFDLTREGRAIFAERIATELQPAVPPMSVATNRISHSHIPNPKKRRRLSSSRERSSERSSPARKKYRLQNGSKKIYKIGDHARLKRDMKE